MVFKDLFEGDLAVQFLIQRDEDGAQAALGMGTEDPETLA